MLNIKPTANKDEFLVQSHSDSNTWYKVNIITRRCTHPFYKNGSTCSHYKDLMKYIEDVTKNNDTIFKQIEKEINEKGNYVEWSVIGDKYGDNVVEQMLQLNRLYQPKKGYLGVY